MTCRDRLEYPRAAYDAGVGAMTGRLCSGGNGYQFQRATTAGMTSPRMPSELRGTGGCDSVLRRMPSTVSPQRCPLHIPSLHTSCRRIRRRSRLECPICTSRPSPSAGCLDPLSFQPRVMPLGRAHPTLRVNQCLSLSFHRPPLCGRQLILQLIDLRTVARLTATPEHPSINTNASFVRSFAFPRGSSLAASCELS